MLAETLCIRCACPAISDRFTLTGSLCLSCASHKSPKNMCQTSCPVALLNWVKTEPVNAHRMEPQWQACCAGTWACARASSQCCRSNSAPAAASCNCCWKLSTRPCRSPWLASSQSYLHANAGTCTIHANRFLPQLILKQTTRQPCSTTGGICGACAKVLHSLRPGTYQQCQAWTHRVWRAAKLDALSCACLSASDNAMQLSCRFCCACKWPCTSEILPLLA